MTDAARLFLSSEKENRALQAPGFDEHLQAALNCYSFAIKVHKYPASRGLFWSCPDAWMRAGLHRDEPARDGGQPLSGAGQRAQGKTSGRCSPPGDGRSPCACRQEMNRPGEAVVHYQRAAELQTQTPTEALLSMGDVATCKILTREYGLRLRLPGARVNSDVCPTPPQGTSTARWRCSRTCSSCVRRGGCSCQAAAHQWVSSQGGPAPPTGGGTRT